MGNNGTRDTASTGVSASARRRLVKALRFVPAAMLLATVMTTAPSASATGCYIPASNIAVNGGTVRNATNVNATADGGLAVSNANGGNDNLAVGILGRASAGNGGTANAQANGGMIDLDNINSGNNVGNVISVAAAKKACYAKPSNVLVNGGTVANETNVNLSANGGIAVANANGGDDNVAVGILGNAAAGNGGQATAAANGGTIAVGDINSGNNTGNVIAVNGTSSGYFGAGANTRIDGGTVRNTTNVNLSADGGLAVANANGGDDNLAVGILGNAAAGNGGNANAQANGGTITVGDINSGGNTGNIIGVTNASGNTQVNGGTVANETNVNLSANGGTAVSNANGGDDNVAVGVLGNASAGNGGNATSQANGGTINVGDINSGNNTGNQIQVQGTAGNTQVNGGNVSNTTNVNVSANGGTAVSNANGGDGNTAVGLGGNASAGNGGNANSSANGGNISLGDINSGGNVGNVISVGQ